MSEPSLSLYLHIPFCKHRCAYCDFNTYTSLLDLRETYADALVAEMAQVWQQLQAELAMRSPQGKQVAVAESGHYIHLEQPQVVIDAINEVVAVARE